MSKKNPLLKANKKGNTKHNQDERARDNVKATDSWLIYLSQDVDKAFKWSKNEIDLLVDSTRCAFDTTKKITNRMIMRPKRDHNLSLSEEALLQELDFAVSECPDDDYLSMGHDVELCQLATLHSPSRKAATREENAMAGKPKIAAPSIEKKKKHFHRRLICS